MKSGPSPTQGDPPKLTPTQEEVLHLLTVERLTPIEISQRRDTSRSAVYQIIRKLRKMGYVSKDYRSLHKPGDSSEGPRQWELHGCKWRVEIIDGQQSKKYRKILGKGNGQLKLKSSTIELYPDVITVHCKVPFRSDHPDKCIIKSWDYLWRVLTILQDDLGLTLCKERRYNIRRYAGHFPRMNDELATQPGASKIKVYDDDDGNLRFHIDWSKDNIPESEFLHPKHGGIDAGTYEDFIRDLKNPHLPLSEASRLSYLAVKIAAHAALSVDKYGKQSKRYWEGADHYAEHHKTHVAAIGELKDQLKSFVSTTESLSQAVKELSDNIGGKENGTDME